MSAIRKRFAGRRPVRPFDQWKHGALLGVAVCFLFVFGPVDSSARTLAGEPVTYELDTRTATGVETLRGVTFRIHHPGASYIAIHFSDFDLAPGDSVLVSDGWGGQSYAMTGRGKMDLGAFWSQHVKGDTAVLVLQGDPQRSFFTIDQYAAGFPEAGASIDPVIGEAICGVDDKDHVVCYKDDYPVEFENANPVARLLVNGCYWCTGWLASPDDHLITNRHCIKTAEDAQNTDYEFGAQASDCDDKNCSGAHRGRVISGAELLSANKDLDYALVQITSGSPSASYGFLEIDDRLGMIGEEIYIPQHPAGFAKQFGIESSEPEDAPSGLCQINDYEAPCYGSGYMDIGYMCDTEGGSSGSPVISRETHKVIALHHCKDCENRGVPIDLVYDDIQQAVCGCPEEMPHFWDDIHKDIQALPASSYPGPKVRMDGKAFFAAYGGRRQGRELYWTDGRMGEYIKNHPDKGYDEVNRGRRTSDPRHLTVFENHLFFVADRHMRNAPNLEGALHYIGPKTEWKIQWVPIRELGVEFNLVAELTPFGDELWFTAHGVSATYSNDERRYAWKIAKFPEAKPEPSLVVVDDPLEPGTASIAELEVAGKAMAVAAGAYLNAESTAATEIHLAGEAPPQIIVKGEQAGLFIGEMIYEEKRDHLFFTSESIDDVDWALWRVTTQTGPELIQLVHGDGLENPYHPVNPIELHLSAGRLFFSGFDKDTGREPWISEGTLDTTKMLADLTLKRESTGPFDFVDLGGDTYFIARATLESSDGLYKIPEEDPFAVHRIRNVLVPYSLASLPDGHLYFAGDGDTGTGQEVWRSDGSTLCTFELLDAYPGSPFSVPKYFELAEGLWQVVATADNQEGDLEGIGTEVLNIEACPLAP